MGHEPAADHETPASPRDDDDALNSTRLIRAGNRSDGSWPRTEYPAPYPPADRRFPFLSPPSQPDEIGRLGEYRVLRLLGQGGMALVFLAEDLSLRRRVALKVMRPDMVRDPLGCERFLREARLAALLKHEHLITIYQAGIVHDVVFLAMELLVGETLEERLTRTGPLPAADILRICREIAIGIQVIHEQGMIHRDVKPANIWLERPADRVKLLDFGLARFIEDETQMTQTGLVVGTPGFMSPEQARGETLDVRSDLFSLGSVMYCLCTGRQPFRASNTMAVLTALAVSNPPAPSDVNSAVPPALSQLIMRLLAKEVDQRPASAAEVLAELQRIIDGGAASAPRPSPAPRRRLPRWAWISGAVALTLAAVGAVVPMVGFPRNRPVDKEKHENDPTVRFLVEQAIESTNNWLKEPPRPLNPDMPPPPRFTGVVVRGRRSPYGVFMHPPTLPEGGTTRVSYRLNQQFRQFHAEVSINDGPRNSATPLTFAVYADGQPLWMSHPVSSQRDSEMCHADVTNVNVLTLEVNCPGHAQGAHAVWIEPHLR